MDKVAAGATVTITRRCKPVARLVLIKREDEQERMRKLIEEIKRTRVGQDRGARPGATIRDLIRSGRRY
jgi:antitoxin (DNA-binding transcriptional repressor) of toxin-antitoxin stability system